MGTQDVGVNVSCQPFGFCYLKGSPFLQSSELCSRTPRWERASESVHRRLLVRREGSLTDKKGSSQPYSRRAVFPSGCLDML